MPGAASPQGRFFSTSAVYDPIDHYVVIFGGYTSKHVYLNDTWAYANGRWSNITSTPAPSPRDHSTMTFDAADGYVLLFGGANRTISFNDTWTFKAGGWTHLTPPVSPPARWAASMAYTGRDQLVILFGGCNVGEMNDTWSFHAGIWTRLTPSVSPSARGGAAFAFDPADNYLTLFGGINGSVIYGDTWWFGAGRWSQVIPPLAPTPRRSASFVFDPILGQMVLFGGSTASGITNETWWFVHRGWQNATAIVAPSPREYAIMANDSQDGYIVLFGGGGASAALYNDTWAYDTLAVQAAVSPEGGLAPLNVTFTESTIQGFAPYQTNWAFGDGGAKSGALAVHTYVYGGVYRPALTVTDRYGAQGIAVLTVVAAGPLVGTFSVVGAATPTSVAVIKNVSFTAAASSGYPPYRYQWAFGDGAVASVSAPIHSYAKPGTFAAKVTAWDAYNTSTNFTLNITVVAALAVTPTAAVTVGTSPFLLSAIANVTGGFPPYAINWSWGDGTFASGANAVHSYRTAATYAVLVSVSDSAGNHASGSFVVQVSAGSNQGFGGLGSIFSGVGGLVIAGLAGAVVGGIVMVVLHRRRGREPPVERWPEEAGSPENRE